MFSPLLALALAASPVSLLSPEAVGANGRTLQLRLLDGRSVKGVLILETSAGLLLRTDAGNVLVKFEEIEASEDEAAPPPASGPPPRARAVDDASQGRPPSRSSPLRLGLSGGIGAGLGFSYSSLRTWLAAKLSLLVDLDFGRLGLRISTPLTAGALVASFNTPYFVGSGMLETQLRLNFSPRFSSGLGIAAGVRGQTDSFGAAFTFGPTLTVLAVRFGEERSHEVSFNGVMAISMIPNIGPAFSGALFTFEYAGLF